MKRRPFLRALFTALAVYVGAPRGWEEFDPWEETPVKPSDESSLLVEIWGKGEGEPWRMLGIGPERDGCVTIPNQMPAAVAWDGVYHLRVRHVRA